MTTSTPDPAWIDPRAAAAYLRVHGWSLARQGELGDRWRYAGAGATRNVAIPQPDLDTHDQSLMMSSALRVLAEVEERPAAAVARDMRDAGSDIVSFRLVGEDLRHGNIPLLAAPEMLGGALDVIRSAARAEVERRAAFQGRVPSQVTEFLTGAVVTPAEKGSVILSVRSDVDPGALSQTSLVSEADRPPVDVPFERRALRRLIIAVRAAKSAAHRDAANLADPDALDGDIDDGLTANLCDALGNLVGEQSELDASVDVGVRWSLFVPSDEPYSQVRLDRGELQALPNISQALRAIQPRPATRVRGYVRNLGREPGEGEGTIRILADLDGRGAVIRIVLSPSDYPTAIRAHELNREIEVLGTLVKAGRMWEMLELTHVSLAPAEAGE